MLLADSSAIATACDNVHAVYDCLHMFVSCVYILSPMFCSVAGSDGEFHMGDGDDGYDADGGDSFGNESTRPQRSEEPFVIVSESSDSESDCDCGSDCDCEDEAAAKDGDADADAATGDGDSRRSKHQRTKRSTHAAWYAAESGLLARALKAEVMRQGLPSFVVCVFCRSMLGPNNNPLRCLDCGSGSHVYYCAGCSKKMHSHGLGPLHRYARLIGCSMYSSVTLRNLSKAPLDVSLASLSWQHRYGVCANSGSLLSVNSD